MAFRFVAANGHSDHDTIAAFRRRFLPRIETLFVQTLSLAREMGVLKLDTVGLDSTKIHANASRHSALSYEHAGRIETQMKAEVADLMARAEAADQFNLTDEDSRIMPVGGGGGGFEQSYNAQAGASAADSLLVLATEVVQAPNDKRQLVPMLGKLAALPDELGTVSVLLADNGYFSEDNACAAHGVDPVIAMGRETHHLSLDERFADGPPPPADASPLSAMAHRLNTQKRRNLYALRKQIPEPVFGMIKSALGFPQFPPRGLDRVRGE